MTKRQCANCRWCLRYTSQDIGQCRRYPPTQNTKTGWLEVSPSDWCGEWADKTITPEQAERRELVRQFAVAIVAGDSERDTMVHRVWQRAAEFADYEGQS